MATTAILHKDSQIIKGPSAHEWNIARIDRNHPVSIEVRSLGCVCKDCGPRSAWLQIIGEFNPDLDQHVFLFIGLLGMRQEYFTTGLRARLRTISSSVGIPDSRLQIVFGKYSPFAERVDNWIAPCPHTILTLMRMFTNLDQLKRELVTMGERATEPKGEPYNRHGLVEMEAKRRWENMRRTDRAPFVTRIHQERGDQGNVPDSLMAILDFSYEEMCELHLTAEEVSMIHAELAALKP